MTYSRLVLFGAGASSGSPSITPSSPPLGSELFGVLVKTFPATWGEVSQDIRSKFDRHFETGMATLLGTYPAGLSMAQAGIPSPHILMQDIAQLFLSYSLAPTLDDLYTKFLAALRSSSKEADTCLATLNYENLLEQSMVNLKLRPRVLRLHGGCQLWIKNNTRIFGGPDRAIGRNMRIVASRIRHLSVISMKKKLGISRQAMYPCMALYAPGKPAQVGQYYLWRIQDRFANRVLTANSLAIVGVRPWLKDDHVWTPILRTSATVYYIGGEADFDDLRRHRGSSRQTIHIATRFDEGLGKLVDAM